MRKIWNMILTEPAIAIGIPIVGFATAAGVWSIDWLAFAAAFTAALGVLFVRYNVAPINTGPKYNIGGVIATSNVVPAPPTTRPAPPDHVAGQ